MQMMEMKNNFSNEPMNEEAMLGEILGNINVHRAAQDDNVDMALIGNHNEETIKTKESHMSFYDGSK